MSKLSKLFRIAGIIIIGVIGVWAISGQVAPGAENAAHQQAVRAVAYGSAENRPASEGSAGGVVEAVQFNLADVDNTKPIDSMYERWQRGELDLDEMEYKVSPAERLALQEAARNMGPQDGIQPWDADHPGGAAPTVEDSFAALDVSDCCGGGTSVPPDSDMAAGIDHLIAVENSSFAIYEKDGTEVIAPILLDNFMGGANPLCVGLFDPTVMYDSEEDRYVMAAENGQHFCLAVTAFDNDPFSWYVYAFDALYYGDEFFDYPHIGIGDHAIFMGANMFYGSIPGGFEGRIYAMDKNAAYAGAAMTWRTASTGYDGSTPQPLNLTGFAQNSVPLPFDTHYFISDYYDGTTAWLWAWPDALGTGNPAVVQTYDLNTLTGFTAGYPVDVPQNGSTDLIAGNDWRFRGFEYRNGQGWTTDTISGDIGSGTVNFERIFTMDLSGAPYDAIYASVGGYGDSHVIFPDLAVDHCGNVASGHGRSDGTMFPSVEVGGMVDGYHGLEMPTMIKAGEASYYSFDGSPLRWGDYSGMAIDPDGKTFWFMGEYAKDIPSNPQAANYGNYIAKLTYDCVIMPLVVSVTRADASPTNQASVDFIVTFTETVTGVDTADFSLTNTGALAGASVTAVSGSGDTYTVSVDTGTGDGTLRLDVNASGTGIEDLDSNPLNGGFTSGEIYTLQRSPVFTDVPLTHWAISYIENIYFNGITTGCGPDIYCPSNPVTRAQMAVFLLRSMHGSDYTPPPATGTVFGDVSIAHWAGSWIEQLAAEGITSGCGGGNYCPNDPVNRDQMAVFLLRAEHGSSYIPTAATGVFDDVSVLHWAAKWIEQLAAEGITSGCGPDIYCPSDPVNRDQMAVFLVNTFNLVWP